MVRRANYRLAATALVFTGLWFVLGLLLMATPVPGALGIAYTMFVAWLLLFFLIMGVSGATLTLAAINGMFPPKSPPAFRHRQPARPSQDAAREGAITTADGRPLPWSQSRLPSRSSRRTTSTPVRRTQPDR